MPLFAPGLVAGGFQLAKKAKLGQRAAGALKKGFGLLKERAKGAKFAATEKGFTLSAPGFQAQGGQAAQGAAARAPYTAAGSTNYLPYLLGGAVLLMLLKK